jgi:surface antigen
MLSKLHPNSSSESAPNLLVNYIFAAFSGLVLFIAPSLASLSVFTQSSEAAPTCQCTTYVANRNGLARNFPHAGDWNDGYLQRNGYRQVAAQPGAIVVMERSFPGSNTAYGHVGIVQSVAGNGKITVRGANQYVGSSLVTEAGCSNVRSTGFGTSINGRRDISFWVK